MEINVAMLHQESRRQRSDQIDLRANLLPCLPDAAEADDLTGTLL